MQTQDTTTGGPVQSLAANPPTQTLFTVDQLIQAEPALGKGSIRDDLFHRTTNGLGQSGAVVYRGRRILIHREKYLHWLASGRRDHKGAAA